MDKKLILVLLLFIAACSESPAVKVVDTYCDTYNPVYLLKEEVPLLSKGTKDQILSNNKTWKQLCTAGKTK